MTLLHDIRAEMAALESARRRKGIVTIKMVANACDMLPNSILGGMTTHHHRVICDALNAAMDDAEQP